MTRIARRQLLTGQTFLWELDAPDIAAAARPGHFVMVRLHDGSERVPLTVADMDPGRGIVTVVVQALGKSTLEMRDRYAEGDDIADLVGPLGQPQVIDKVGHVVLVGGGLGVAPVFPQLRAFAEQGNRTTTIVGFRSADLVFWEDRLRPYSDELVVCTDDGSYGRPGLVTEALAEVCEHDRPDLVVAIGPLPMMRACAEVTRPFGVHTVVSLNTIMVDGTGMCGSCRVTVDGTVRFACVDGPDFDAHQVDFGELVSRQRRFAGEEARATDDWAHVCSLEQHLIVEGRHAYKKLRELEPEQVPMPQRDAGSRVLGFDEVNLGYSLGEALREAERCIQCARPTCISGCPVSIDIPRFIRHLLVRDVDGALDVINESSILPSVCGRVCPQETQCESQCIVGRKMAPVAIGRLERFVGDHGRVRPGAPAPDEGDPRPTALGRVAVVGSGPAGLACAADLVKAGAEVTVFEALHVVGGVLRYGIPAFRLPRDTIDREVQRLVDAGVRFTTDAVVGRTFSVAQLLEERGFDAVFLGVGAGAPAFLGIPGESAGRVYSANELLTRVNLMGGDQFPLADTPVPIGSRVVVVGAGNTAMDCLRVARRLGAPSVTCVYRRSEAEAPARAEELRHAKEEGIEFLFLHNPVEIHVDEAGGVRGMTIERMTLGEPDEQGRRRPLPTGELIELDCDTVIVALGTNANPIVTRSTPGLELDRRGYVQADATSQATSLPGVFAGGDIVTGGATVILAMGAGRRAAASIVRYLQQGKLQWPPDEGGDEVAPPVAPTSAARAAACPKCGRPLEDGDEYVCCAGDVVSWRCDGCGKVSEGFALPYGQCPACGGHLSMLGERRFDGAGEAEEAVRAAFEIELGGIGFYTQAAADARDPVLRALFERFAAMEHEHLATLARRYHVSPPAPSGLPAARAALFAGIDAHPDRPEHLFEVAIAAERRAVAFFASEAAGRRGAVRALYDELAAEEREHVDLLVTELDRWRAGRAGLLTSG